jgi:hypothetical protein
MGAGADAQRMLLRMDDDRSKHVRTYVSRAAVCLPRCPSHSPLHRPDPSVSSCSCETSAVTDMPLPRSTLLISSHNLTVSCFHKMILNHCTLLVGEEICHSLESIIHFG